MSPARTDPRSRPVGGRVARFAAAVSIVAMLGIMFYVLRNASTTAAEAERRLFDPVTTNMDELRRVTESVSRIIAAPNDPARELALQTLESLRVTSAGARDLRESCANTYRPLQLAEADQAEMRALIAVDGGIDLDSAAPPVAPRNALRAEEIYRHAREQIELANQSQDRCMDLYTEATRRLGLAPARRRGGG